MSSLKPNNIASSPLSIITNTVMATSHHPTQGTGSDPQGQQPSEQDIDRHPDHQVFTTPRPINSSEITFDLKVRRKGVCKFFNSQKGFGFINDDHPDQLGNQEVFVHYTSIGNKGGFRSLAEVEYVVSPGQKGFQATEVTGPGGRPVQGDVKSKLPKTPNLVPYPMGIMPASYALAGGGSPYLQQDPYLAAAAHYGSPYGSQVFYVPSTVGLVPARHSPSLAGMSPYQPGHAGHHTARSPTIPFGHHPHSQMAMALASPQTGFGFGSPSMAGYGIGPGLIPQPASAGILGSSTSHAQSMGGGAGGTPTIGINSGTHELRSPSLAVPHAHHPPQFGSGGGGPTSPNFAALPGSGHHQGLGLRADMSPNSAGATGEHGQRVANTSASSGGGGGGVRTEERGISGTSSIGSFSHLPHHHPTNQNGSSSLLYSSNSGGPITYQ